MVNFAHAVHNTSVCGLTATSLYLKACLYYICRGGDSCCWGTWQIHKFIHNKLGGKLEDFQEYDKCPKISNTVFELVFAYILFLILICLPFINFLLKWQRVVTLIRLLRSSLIRICNVCKCHYVRKVGVGNFRTISVTTISPNKALFCRKSVCV